MENIQKVLKEKYDLDTTIEHGVIVGDNGLIKVQVEPPRANCDVNDEHGKWLLRMAPSESFDRWSVSAAICDRFFEPSLIVFFLYDEKQIYRRLFNHLSSDYKELYGKWEELEYEGFEQRP